MSRSIQPERDSAAPAHEAGQIEAGGSAATPADRRTDGTSPDAEPIGSTEADLRPAAGVVGDRSPDQLGRRSGPIDRELPQSRAGAARPSSRRFGTIKVGSAFFGWLTATGLTVLLVGLLAALGVGMGWIDEDSVLRTARQPGTDQARSLGLAAGIVVLVVLFVSYLAGGYVAGRMARFRGILQGVAVWLWGVVMAAVIAAVTAVTGYDALPGLDLPALLDGAVGLEAWLAVLVAVVTALLGAILGGLWGMRFHRRVDRALLEGEQRP